MIVYCVIIVLHSFCSTDDVIFLGESRMSDSGVTTGGHVPPQSAGNFFFFACHRGL